MGKAVKLFGYDRAPLTVSVRRRSGEEKPKGFGKTVEKPVGVGAFLYKILGKLAARYRAPTFEAF